MRKSIGFLALLALLISSTVQASAWAEITEQPEMPGGHAHMVMDTMDEAHCETEQHAIDFSCMSHCTFVQAAPLEIPLPIRLANRDHQVPGSLGDAKIAITPHWRPPISFS